MHMLSSSPFPCDEIYAQPAPRKVPSNAWTFIGVPSISELPSVEALIREKDGCKRSGKEHGKDETSRL